MTAIYVPVPVTERLPEIGKVITVYDSNGMPYRGFYINHNPNSASKFFASDYGWYVNVSYWLEEKQLPTAMEIHEASETYTEDVLEQPAFRDGANHIINIIKGKNK